MGQYYKPTVIHADGNVSTLYSRDFSNGAKLTEHSYIGNEFVNAALILIENRPQRVAWIGDYSNDPYEDRYGTALQQDEFMHYYNIAWDAEDKADLPRSFFNTHKLDSILTMRTARKHLVNHSKRQYIDMGEFIAANQWLEEGSWANGKYRSYGHTAWCMNPLPLLTSCGNDRGGGDYYDTHPDYDKVGLWAFDMIEYTTRVPKEYEKAAFSFSEKTIAELSEGSIVS